MKKPIDPKIYDKNYYLGHSKGFKRMLEKLSPHLRVKSDMKVLDLGCGNGDLLIYLAQRGANVVGIDYSKDAVSLTKKKLEKQELNLKKRVKIYIKDAKKLDFKKNCFDMVISIDVFEHLYQGELDIVMQKISKVLKPNGILLVHTEANKIYLDFMHKIYIYPVSQFLIYINKLLTGKIYPGLPKDPRSKLHKIQHVNEPTYLSLRMFF